MSTDGVEARLRAQLMGDVMARELAGGIVTPTGDVEIRCDWTIAALAPGTVIANAVQDGFTARRDAALLRDGDDDVSIFIGRGGEGLFEQNDRRIRLKPGEAVVVAHGRPVASWWPAAAATVVRIPRAALGRDDLIHTAGGVKLARDAAATRLLTAYVDAAAHLPAEPRAAAVAARHLAELATLALETAMRREGDGRRGAGARAARIALMREAILANLTDPSLSMARVARAVGLSERAGYLAFADAGVVFSDLVVAARLDRAHAALAGGYAGKIVDLALAVGFSDLSHFNRRFRERFGATPSELRQR